MKTISRYDYLKMISEKRSSDNLSEAIRVAQEARLIYPDENIFEKLLGDLYFQHRQYEEAGDAYRRFLLKIGDNTQYIGHFSKFLYRYLGVVEVQTAQNYIQKIVKDLETSGYPEPIVINICKIIAPHMQLDAISLFEDDRNFRRVTSYIRKNEQSCCLYIIFERVLLLRHSFQNKGIDKFVVSSMEKKGWYKEALQLIKTVLQYDTDQVAVRTMFRICRKLNDYTAAEGYLRHHPEIKESESFNVLYELVFYFSNIGNIEERNGALEKIEKNDGGSIPIMRTLYNLYLQFGMIQKAEEAAVKISSLESGREKRQNKDKREWNQQEEDSVFTFLDSFRNMFQEIEHSRKMISMSEILKGFSHELGQPITNIRYSIQLYQMKMEKGIHTEDELKVMLNDILSQTLRVRKLLSRFSPIVSEKENETEFNVAQKVKEVFDEFAERLKEENIEWKIDVKNDFSLKGDKVKFDQIFYNFISNSIYAIKERGEKGWILVTVSEKAKYYQISFQDNGTGIEEKYLDKIFEPFFTTKENTLNDSNGGEGLGLYIIWNIVQMFGGRIVLDKQFYKGARFIIKFEKDKRKLT